MRSYGLKCSRLLYTYEASLICGVMTQHCSLTLARALMALWEHCKFINISSSWCGNTPLTSDKTYHTNITVENRYILSANAFSGSFLHSVKAVGCFENIDGKCDIFTPFEVSDAMLQLWLNHPFAYSLENPCEGNYIESRTPFWGCTFPFSKYPPTPPQWGLVPKHAHYAEAWGTRLSPFCGNVRRKKRMLSDSLKMALFGLSWAVFLVDAKLQKCLCFVI